MKTLYLDIFSGMSGDMLIGALLDLGVDLQAMERELAKLNVAGYHLHAERRQKSGIAGVKFDVHIGHPHHPAHDPNQAHEHEHEHDHGQEHEHLHDHDHEHEHQSGHGHSHEHTDGPEHELRHGESRDFSAIRELIQSSQLSDWVKEKAVAVFGRIAVAEGKVHGRSPEQVHFHEVGAVDSIVDIVGACVGLEILGKPRVISAPVVEGTGWVECAHGRFPIPTAATLEILGARGVPVTQCEEPHELVTPTGAALLAEFAVAFTPMQSLVASKIGYGLGTRDNQTRPNVLRAILTEGPTDWYDWETDSTAVLESNLDDLTPEILGHFVESALAAGALDVFYTAAQMKKNRPGTLLTLLCAPSEADRFSEMILRETSAFGVRCHLADRRKLRREFATVETAFGKVTVKRGWLNGQLIQATPEFESCKALARETGVTLKRVYEEAQKAITAANEKKVAARSG